MMLLWQTTRILRVPDISPNIILNFCTYISLNADLTLNS